MTVMSSDDEGVWCECGGRMRPVEGRKFPGNRRWLWWSCQDCGKTPSTAMPLPMRRETAKNA
jgi:hypothetical protein